MRLKSRMRETCTSGSVGGLGGQPPRSTRHAWGVFVGLPELEKIEIRSDDGVSSRITVFRAAAADSTVVIIMPAMGVPASFYEPLATALVDQGLNVVTADLRGHGESSIRPGKGVDYGYGEMVLYDWPCIIDRVEGQFPDAPKVILGHSLGGQLTPLIWPTTPARSRG